MHIVLGGFGTRGDVQPVLATAQALVARGHTCELFVPPNSVEWVRGFGIPVTAVGLDYEVVSKTASTGKIMDVLRTLPLLRRELVVQAEVMGAAVQRADVLVGSSVFAAGHLLAGMHRKPYVYLAFSPGLIPCREIPSPTTPMMRLPKWLNVLSWYLNRLAWNVMFLRDYNRPRVAHGLAKVTDAFWSVPGDPMLIATEPGLAPVGTPLWPTRRIEQTGAIFMPETDAITPDVEEFLSQGPPPVYVGFGSMSDPDPKRTGARLLEALKIAGVRALIARGWAGLEAGDVPDNVRFIGPQPHGKLFPRCAAVVHHGGSGTTHIAAKSGIPQVVLPHILDQFYFAHRVGVAGIGIALSGRFQLNAKTLGEAIRRCTSDAGLIERAKVFGASMATDGLARVVAEVEKAGIRG